MSHTLQRPRHVLITGSNGQLGGALHARLAGESGVDLQLLTPHDADFCEPDALREVVLRSAPNLVINCAAMTAVDAAEAECSQAMRINAEAVCELAKACEKMDARLVQISTDYVFDGDADSPYSESALPRPRSWYGISKLAGEHAARAYARRSLVVRTSGLFAVGGSNFVATMLRLGREGRSLGVVDDQTTAPTYAPHLADALWRMIEAVPELNGTVHLSARGHTTWFGFARAIFDSVGLAVELTPTTTAAYAAPATRPAYSLLANETLERLGHPPLPTWQQGLADYLAATTAASRGPDDVHES